MKEKTIEYDKHTFVICAYQESLYLEECIASLMAQKGLSHIIIVTSTPNKMIKECAEKYDLPLYINHGTTGIDGDWNFALECANTPYVTIAHQDDYYDKLYSQKIMQAVDATKHPLILFTNYAEIRNGEKVNISETLRIKRLLLLPLRCKFLQSFKFVRRRILGLGNSICCPSVTYCVDNLQLPLFHKGMESNIDWEAWEKVSKQKGKFVYLNDILMYHRIHEESTTSKIIGENKRSQEDLYMLCKFWPKWMAKLINHYYIRAEQSNYLE